jgi:hypothetical protein
MEETQVKRSAGRPANQPQVAEVQTTAKKKPLVRYEFDESKPVEHATYEIIGDHGVTYMINQHSINVFDEESKSVRQIRYCPGEPSVFYDEQNPSSKKEPIIFRDGNLFVPREKPNLQEFLRLHPGNEENGGSMFRVVNTKRNVEKELTDEFSIFDSVAMVREKTIDELLPVAMFYSVNVDRPVSEIKYDLLQIAKSKPKQFMSAFDDPMVKVRSVLNKASQYQIIKFADNGCYWFDTGSLIVAVPVGQQPLDVMTRFCLTERGSTALSSIEAQLEKI